MATCKYAETSKLEAVAGGEKIACKVEQPFSSVRLVMQNSRRKRVDDEFENEHLYRSTHGNHW
jgi:hypothetical protein